MLAGSAALAFGPLLVRMAETPPVASAFWRMALAVLPLVVLARLGGGSFKPGRGGLWLALLAAAFFAADLAAWHLGILRTTLANATLMGNGTTFFLPIWALVARGQRLGRPGGYALALAAFGIALLLGGSAELSGGHLLGDLLCLLAAAFYTGYLVVVERLRSTLGALPLLALISAFGALLLLPLSLATEPRLWPGHWEPVVALAIGSQVIGQGLVVYAIPHLRPLVIGLTLLLQPMISTGLGVVLYGEVPDPPSIVGMVLIASALLLARLPARAAPAPARS